MQRWKPLQRAAAAIAVVLGASAPALTQPAPTMRYAKGEDVDLALIIAEWKSRMPDIPVFSCTCQENACDHQERWPFRAYKPYQSTVALGPFNAAYTESQGFKCYDIATGESPAESEEPERPALATRAEVVNDGRGLKITRDGKSRVLFATSLDINIIDALDCGSLSQVPQKRFNTRFLSGDVAVDFGTGLIAVGAILDECVETQQSAVFIIEPQGQGVDSMAFYRLAVPGAQALPDGVSSYALDSITGLGYLQGHLMVRHATVADNEALLVFKPGRTPAGEYAGCIELREGENPAGLCP